MKEYKEKIRHSCGCIIEHVTLYKIPRRRVKQMRENECGSCQLKLILAVDKKKHLQQVAFCSECGCPTRAENGAMGCSCNE